LISAPPGQAVRSDPARSTRYRAARERRNDLYEALLGRHPPGTAWSDAGARAPHVTRPSTNLANTIEP
jgi:hypothetical protein